MGFRIGDKVINAHTSTRGVVTHCTDTRVRVLCKDGSESWYEPEHWAHKKPKKLFVFPYAPVERIQSMADDQRFY